MGKIRMDIIK
jgi:hypothetical protein